MADPGPKSHKGFQKSLSTDDLNTVYTTTYEARNKWANILLALGIDDATIQCIDKKRRGDPDDCYRDGLSQWLKRGTATRLALTEALQSPSVGHGNLAAKCFEQGSHSQCCNVTLETDNTNETAASSMEAGHLNAENQLTMPTLDLHQPADSDQSLVPSLPHSAATRLPLSMNINEAENSASQTPQSKVNDWLQNLDASADGGSHSQYCSVTLETDNTNETAASSMEAGHLNAENKLTMPTLDLHQPADSDQSLVPSSPRSAAERIKQFERRFHDLRTFALTEVMDKNTSVDKFRQTLMTLPNAISKQHEEFIIGKYPVFMKIDSVEYIFTHLNFYLSFLDFSLLEHVIEHYGSSSVREKMKQYSRDMEKFRMETLVADVIPHLSGRPEPPPHFARLKMKLNFDPKTCTLEDVEKHRKKLGSEFLLSKFAVFLVGIGEGSLIVVCLVPLNIVPTLKKHIQQKRLTFFLNLEILKFSVNEECLYPFSTPKHGLASGASSSQPVSLQLQTEIGSQASLSEESTSSVGQQTEIGSQASLSKQSTSSSSQQTEIGCQASLSEQSTSSSSQQTEIGSQASLSEQSTSSAGQQTEIGSQASLSKQSTSSAGRQPFKLEWADKGKVKWTDSGKEDKPLYSSSDGIFNKVDGIAYVRPSQTEHILTFNSKSGEWAQLPECQVKDTTLAILNGKITTVGGLKKTSDCMPDEHEVRVNKLYSFIQREDEGTKEWEEVLPAMPTKRSQVTAVSTEEKLIVAGGRVNAGPLATVEILDVNTKVWSTSADLPKPFYRASGCVCKGDLYLVGGARDKLDPVSHVFRASISDILQSRSGEVFHPLANIPFKLPSCVSIGGQVLAIGGLQAESEQSQLIPSKFAYRYDPRTDCWQQLDDPMHTPRGRCFAVALSESRLMVVGGYAIQTDVGCTNTVEFANFTKC